MDSIQENDQHSQTEYIVYYYQSIAGKAPEQMELN